MIRVAIVGCGKVADTHAEVLQRIPGCKIVGVCDRESLMAEQLASRLQGVGAFSDVGRMLSGCSPTVVHITTPPQAHFDVARECLEAGCNVYVEKPFTINAAQAVELVRLAESRARKLTVGHNTQFSPVARAMRQMIAAGYLGGPPVHIESYYCYDFGDERYAKALLGDSDHWVRKLPGGLLHNIISHGIGKIVELMKGDDLFIQAHGFTSGFLRRMGETEIKDELRVILRDQSGTTAYFTFSSQISPPLHQLRVFGPRNSLVSDHHHQTLIKVPAKAYKSYLNQFIPPFIDARQYMANGFRNIRKFLARDFHADSGMHFLVSAFYRSIEGGEPLPIPYRDIILTAKIMDEVFSQINGVETRAGRLEQTLCSPNC
ncbi:MAG: Gfo/Idh/MocA family oxidoreductase [Verrucomicrobiota bacterium]